MRSKAYEKQRFQISLEYRENRAIFREGFVDLVLGVKIRFV